VGVDRLAGQKELESGAAAHQAWQPLRAAIAGDQPQLGFGLAHLCVIGGQAEGAGHCQLASAAEREAANAGDDGLAERLHAAEGFQGADDKGRGIARRQAVKFGNVGSGGKGATARAGEQDDANLGVSLQGCKRGIELGEGCGVEGIENLRTVDGNDGQRRALFDADMSKGHPELGPSKLIPFRLVLSGVRSVQNRLRSRLRVSDGGGRW
jgi:hypothetical protein